VSGLEGTPSSRFRSQAQKRTPLLDPAVRRVCDLSRAGFLPPLAGFFAPGGMFRGFFQPSNRCEGKRLVGKMCIESIDAQVHFSRAEFVEEPLSKNSPISCAPR
jgi:hypothetical protein